MRAISLLLCMTLSAGCSARHMAKQREGTHTWIPAMKGVWEFNRMLVEMDQKGGGGAGFLGFMLMGFPALIVSPALDVAYLPLHVVGHGPGHFALRSQDKREAEAKAQAEKYAKIQQDIKAREAADKEYARSGRLHVGVAVRAGRVLVTGVDPAGPGAAAGVRNWDRIVEVDGVPISLNVDAAVEQLRGKPDSVARLTVERAGAPRPLSIEVKRKAGEPAAEMPAVFRDAETARVDAALAVVGKALRAGQVDAASAGIKSAFDDLPPMGPASEALRMKIIDLVRGLGVEPGVPEEARKHMVRARTFIDNVASETSMTSAARELEKATDLAPWWGQAYYNLGITNEKARDYAGAIRALNLYAATEGDPEKVRTTKDKIYKLEAMRDLGR